MTKTSQVMIEARSLSKSYGSFAALKDLSFAVSRGEVVGFLGPNGAGKTTTMRILTGFLMPSTGQALIGGVDVAEQPLATRARIGYLPESAPLYEEMMVADFMHFVADMHQLKGPERSKRLGEICDRCGLSKVLGKDIGQLSKGYRQRVGLAQAMVHDPDILILDEPTSGLDPNQIVEIRELIKDIGREKTVILSTHILPEVQATCGRVMIISDGALVADDTPEGLIERESGAIIEVELKAANGTPAETDTVQNLLTGVDGVRSVKAAKAEAEGVLNFRVQTDGASDPREGLFHAAVANDLVLLGLHREQASLEDTFRRLTRGEGGTHV